MKVCYMKVTTDKGTFGNYNLSRYQKKTIFVRIDIPKAIQPFRQIDQ